VGVLRDGLIGNASTSSVSPVTSRDCGTIAPLSALAPLHLLAADPVTLHLDLAAAQRGYTNHP
jgi:hypothetical protein